MTVVVSIDFTSDYADESAMLADGWTKEDSETWGHAEFAVDGSGAAVSVLSGVDFWGGAGWYRTFTGLTPGAFYAVEIEASCVRTTDPCQVGMQAHTVSSTGGGFDLFAASEARTLSVASVPAHTDGTIIVRMGFFPSSTGPWHDDSSFTATTLTISDNATEPEFTSSLPIRGIDWDQIAYTAGVISVGGSAFGLTRGGLRFDPGETFEALPFDGDLVAPVGVHEMTGQKPRFIGSFLPVGSRHLAFYLPASTQTGGADATVVTPIIPGTLLTTGDYSQNVSVTWPYLSGGTITVTFPYAFWQRYEFTPENKGEMLIPCEILGVPLTAATAPYYITVVEPGEFS